MGLFRTAPEKHIHINTNFTLSNMEPVAFPEIKSDAQQI